MKSINAAKFKEQCLKLLDSVDPEGITITKHGRPVARLVPVLDGSGDLIGSLGGKIKILSGDLLSAGVEWDADS